jgi:NodT family efflux transporter outer membrane factor (OMF) lipoprotein
VEGRRSFLQFSSQLVHLTMPAHSCHKLRGDRRPYHVLRAWVVGGLIVTQLAGCTSFSEYVNNGFKVGPNYGRPPAPVEQDWIDAADKRLRQDDTNIDQWWTVFNDPVLNGLVQNAYRQNLTLREAGFRVLQARAQLGIAVGEFFPQEQFNEGGFTSNGVSVNVANRQATPDRWFSQWDYGFGLGWELDFWGRFRRAIESADAELNASVEDYDDVLVTLLADVGRNYVEYRTLEERLKLARSSVELFTTMLEVPKARYQADEANRVAYDLAQANLAQAQALVAQLEISQRQSANRLCILLGMTPRDLQSELGRAPIPIAPAEVAVGIPADLLRRRPDVRRAERDAAAQSAVIGIAESDFYPHISLVGTLGWSSQDLNSLFVKDSFRGTAGPSFRWDILNYCRLRNNVRYQEALFQELVTRYQQSALSAAGEAENAIVFFLKSQERVRALNASAAAWRDGTSLLETQYRGQMIDYTPVGFFAQNLLEQQDQAAQAQGDVALALVEIYRAIGGGWQVRLGAGADAPKVEIPQCLPATTVEPLPPGEIQPVTPLVPAQAKDLAPKKLPPTTNAAPLSQPWAKEPQ